ncbi:MAG: sigma-70 family RNA polymerase sigma factor [Bacteroidota bacterium]
MPEQHPDQRLIEGLTHNDYATIKEIDKKYRAILTKWVLHNSGSREDAEDLFTDSVLAIFDRISRTPPLILTRPFSAYLMGIARNKWLERLRKRKKEMQVRNDQIKRYIDEMDESVEEVIIHTEKVFERNRQLEKTFVQLSERCQQLIDLIFNRGMDTSEIVQEMAFNSENAYYVRKKKCLDRWRSLLHA